MREQNDTLRPIDEQAGEGKSSVSCPRNSMSKDSGITVRRVLVEINKWPVFVFNKGNLKLPLKALIIILISICTIYLLANKAIDLYLEKKVINKILSAKCKNYINEIDFVQELDSNINMICLQGPYMLKEDFEAVSHAKIRYYSEIGDDRYILWLFYTNGMHRKISISRFSLMDRYKISNSCSIYHPKLYFIIKNNIKYYYL